MTRIRLGFPVLLAWGAQIRVVVVVAAAEVAVVFPDRSHSFRHLITASHPFPLLLLLYIPVLLMVMFLVLVLVLLTVMVVVMFMVVEKSHRFL